MKVGKHIKMLRTAKNMTIKQLAEKTDMSIGFISNIERDINSPTVSALQNICSALDVDISSFFNMASQSTYVYKKNERKQIEMPEDSGIISELIPFSNKILVPTCLTIEPGGYYGDPYTSHKGDEVCFVLEGTVTFRIGSDSFELSEGDCIYINSLTPHQIINQSSTTARTFAVTMDI